MAQVSHIRRIWDAPTRIVHWALVVLLGVSWWSAKAGKMEWHTRSGLALCALLLFRLIWGFAGGSTARFSQFVKGPRTAFAYMRSGETWRGLGHNPLGGWSVLALLLLLATQIITGLFAVDVDGIESGPLSAFVSFDQGRLAAAVHATSFTLLLAMAAFHIAAIIFYLLIKRKNLIWPMLTGTQTVEEENHKALVPAPLWALVLAIMATAFLTYSIAHGLRF